MKRAIHVRPSILHTCTIQCCCACISLSAADTVDTRQVARESLIALGTCIGKFTHTNKFMLTIGALDILAQYSKYKVRCDCIGQQPIRGL